MKIKRKEAKCYFTLNFVNMKASLTLLMAFLGLALTTTNKNPLTLTFSWFTIDYKFQNDQDRKEALNSGRYIPDNNVISRIELWKDKLFISTPRLKSGVPSTLNYIQLDRNESSPLLIPYPSWELNDNSNKSSKIKKMISVHGLSIDVCDRLWALDDGNVRNENNGNFERESIPRIFIFDLRSDLLINEIPLEKDLFTINSKFLNIIVDVNTANCEKAFAYLADSGDSALVVFSLFNNVAYKIFNNYLSFDPIAGDYMIIGQKYQWSEGILGMALTPPNRDGERYLMFHPFVSTMEFGVCTKYLQNKATENFTKYFQIFGNRGKNTQSSSSCIDMETGVEFYTTNLNNGIFCWNPLRGEELSAKNQGNIVESDNLMSFPYDLKIDKSGFIWILSNDMTNFLHKTMNNKTTPFNIHKGKVRHLIKGTVCEEM